MANDSLQTKSYFRFNPQMSEIYSLDENAPERLDQMVQDAQVYIKRNEAKMMAAATAIKRTSLMRRVFWPFYS